MLLVDLSRYVFYYSILNLVHKLLLTLNILSEIIKMILFALTCIFKTNLWWRAISVADMILIIVDHMGN